MKERIIHTQYCDEKSILIITKAGRIKRLFTPFKVISIEAVEIIPIHSLVIVEEVFTTERDQLVYLIQGTHFYHFYFHITLLEELRGDSF